MLTLARPDTELLGGRLQFHGPEELVWPFRGEPNYHLRPYPHKPGWSRTIQVDPFPAYPHNWAYVQELIPPVESAFPVDFPPTWHLLAFEELGRTNGHASRDQDYQGGDLPSKWMAHIVFGAKRIPIHPAMTRYLVAHEYGHVVQEHLEYRLGIQESRWGMSDLEKDYAALRGCEDTIVQGYGGHRWHASIGELFANDFRILICDVEPEFWPHPGFPQPQEVPGLREWWERMRAEHAADPG